MKHQRKGAILAVGIVVAYVGLVSYYSLVPLRTRMALQGEWMLISFSPSQRPLRIRITVDPTHLENQRVFPWHSGAVVTFAGLPSFDGNILSINYAFSSFDRLRFLSVASTLRLTPIMNLPPDTRQVLEAQWREMRIPYEEIVSYALVDEAGQRILYLQNAANETLLTLTTASESTMTSPLVSP